MSTGWEPLPTFGPHDDSDKPRYQSCAYGLPPAAHFEVITVEQVGKYTRAEVDNEVIRLQSVIRDMAIAIGISPCPTGEYRFYRDFVACVISLLKLSNDTRLK